eukprot:TRINITY_DN40168_c0_g1_i2.p1 TRINITY_DN40168_c0_g1~~TRINITY_DN40168_c0_g1_i2.p1  ORF type:complete len:203 (-),score=39.15 TRINITY_DN40168_c0_g1_i2:8-616(-)
MRKILLAPIAVTWVDPIKTVFEVTMLTFYDSLSTFFLIGVLLSLYGYLGMLCFYGQYNYPNQIPNDSFDSPYTSSLAMAVMLTSENYPAVASPGYVYSPWALLYFMPGMFCCFLAEGLVLGRVYDSYTRRMQYAVQYLYSRELRGYAFAFLVITEFNRQVRLKDEVALEADLAIIPEDSPHSKPVQHPPLSLIHISEPTRPY